MDHLGLDLGTTTISAAVLDADGRLLCTRTVPGGAAIAGQPWERKQDARGIEHAALSLLDGLLQEFPDIGCVGLTGQMHFDENRNVVKEAIIIKIDNGAYKFEETFGK